MSKNEELLQQAYRFLEAKGFATQFNRRYTHVQLKICPYCGNDRWNFDIELTDRFVYGCWACSAGGWSASFFRRLGAPFVVPTPDGSAAYASKRTQESFLFYRYDAQLATVDGTQIIPSTFIKPLLQNQPICFNGQRISSGVMILGQRHEGLLVVDAERRRPRWSAPDFYVFENQPTIRRETLVVVENYYDIFPFFTAYRTLILGGSTIRHSILEDAKELFRPIQRVLIALDRHAEKPFLQQLRLIAPHVRKYILRPDKHSPSESSALSLVNYT